MPTENESRKEAYDSRYDALVERMPEMEQGAGVALDCVTVNYCRASHVLSVFCEIRYAAGKSKLKTSVDLNIVSYDTQGRIVDKDDRRLYPDDFMGFAVKELSFCDMPPRKVAAIGKIRVFPTKA